MAKLFWSHFMRKLITLIAFSFSTISMAETIVTAPGTLEQLGKKTRENEYYIKRGPAKFKIFYFDIGKAVTPYYLSESTFKRYYKNEKKCFELTIQDKINLARRVKCKNKLQDLHFAGFEDFKATNLSEFYAVGWKGFEIESTQQNFVLEAYLQTQEMYDRDRQVYGPGYDQIAPKKKFNVSLSTSSKIQLTEKKVEFLQNFKLSSDKVGILSEKTQDVKSSIVAAERTLVFTNGQGQLLIYNTYMRNPFGDYRRTLNVDLTALLKKLNDLSTTGAVCFRDDYLTRRANDCHKLIFETHSLTKFNKVQFMLVDFKNQNLKLIDE
jgi:hypothetical protein